MRRALAEAGAAVALADLNREAAGKAAEALESDGFRAAAVPVDITDRGSTAAMAEQTADALGGIDILVNNAALMAEIPQVDVLDLPAEWFDRVMRVNVLGALHCVAAVKPHLVERGGGRIINQVSAGAFIPGGIYGMSKIALVSFTLGMARVAGATRDQRQRDRTGPRRERSRPAEPPGGRPAPARMLANTIPGKKSAPADDLLGTLLLLASDAGVWINGQVISVDGGWIMRL